MNFTIAITVARRPQETTRLIRGAPFDWLRNIGKAHDTIHWRPVHSNLEKLQNATFFLRLDLPSKLIRHDNGALWKHSSNRRNLKTLALRLTADGNHFENKAFQKRWRRDKHVISLPQFSSNTNPKWPIIVAFSNFSGVVLTEPEK